MSRFQFGGSSSNSSTSDLDDDDETLPYPTPLQRRDFLAPDFSPSDYLSTLHNRHQTLEDLRSELRSRSQLLSKELLDLVNSNYQDFLGLGRSLRSGDEKVEEVRVGLLGFRKEVDTVRQKVAEKEDHVKELVDERLQISKQISVGRSLLELDARLSALESRLMVDMTGKSDLSDEIDDDYEDNETSDEEEDEVSSTVSVSQLRRHIQQYRLLQEIANGVGEEHPFVSAQTPRFIKIRNTLLLDLSTALREARASKGAGAGRVLRILKAYAEMDESVEAVELLRGNKA
jgi:hypothetical protein